MGEYIFLVTKEHYNPLNMIRSLGEKGIRPILVAVKGDLKFVGQSRYVKEKYYVDSTEEGIELIIKKFAGKGKEKSFILTGDDVTVAALDKYYDRLKDDFYFTNAGEAGKITHYMSKDLLNELVAKHGIRTARTWKVKVGDIPTDIEYPVMTKAMNSIGEEWKGIVFVCHNDEELREAFSKIKSKEVLLQQYVKKVDEVSFDGISIKQGGEVIVVMEAHQEYCLPNTYSPYWNIRNCENQEMQAKIIAVIKELGYEGIFEFEFIVDTEGNYWFLEINFRSTALGYATTVAGMSQVTLWCDAMVNGKIQDSWYQKVPANMKAMAECYDYDVRVKGGVISKKEWNRQYRECQCRMYRGRRDFIPFVLFMWYKLTKMHH